MMKILKRGQVPEHRVFALEHRCAECGTIYRLEHGDHYWFWELDGHHLVNSTCPICGNIVKTRIVSRRKPGITLHNETEGATGQHDRTTEAR
jgi:predicted RNA-binding Zn-ribbon protein involved in translation (DUF1610 family)